MSLIKNDFNREYFHDFLESFPDPGKHLQGKGYGEIMKRLLKIKITEVQKRKNMR
jgi:hypothetical protein